MTWLTDCRFYNRNAKYVVFAKSMPALEGSYFGLRGYAKTSFEVKAVYIGSALLAQKGPQVVQNVMSNLPMLGQQTTTTALAQIPQVASTALPTILTPSLNTPLISMVGNNLQASSTGIGNQVGALVQNSNPNAGVLTGEGANANVGKLLDDISSERVKLHDLSEVKQAEVAEALKEKSPIKIPDNVRPKIEQKVGGYDQITYKWNDGTHTYEVRWHTSTPNAPDTPPNWRVDTKQSGFPGGKDPITGEKIPGYPAKKEVLIFPENAPYYPVSVEDWNAAVKAYNRNTATPDQLDMLKWGHYISD